MHLFTVGAIPGKGLGVTAEVDLRRGQKIMKEAPLIESPANVKLSSPSLQAANQYFSSKVEVLNADQQQVFYSLSDWRNEQAGLPKTAYHVFRSNALPKGHGQRAEGAAVYPTICRINHSCQPNCHYSWNRAQGCEVVHAISDIHPGEELGVTYIELFATHTERRKILSEKFGFACSCPACSAQGNELQESNERRSQLAALDLFIRESQASDPKKAVEALDDFVQLFEDEGIADSYLTARIYRIAHEICRRRPDLGDARRFAELGLADFTVCEGSDGDAAQELRCWLAQQPVAAAW